METIAKIFVGALILVGTLTIMALVFTLPIMWLWNASLPVLFGFKSIEFWMAWKLSWLSAFLFKSSSLNINS